MSTKFKFPGSVEEEYQLQRDTTRLLREHRLRIAMNKLCPRNRSDDAEQTAQKRRAVLARFQTEEGVIAATDGPAPETALRWRKRAKKVFKQARDAHRDVWGLVEERSGNIDSWYAFKAQLQFYLVEELSGAKRDFDLLCAERRRGALDAEGLEGLSASVLLLLAYANALAATPEGRPEKFNGGGSKRSPNSKSASIKRRPDDWRERVAATMEGDLKLLYLMQCVTGCRPAELKSGVSVELLADGELEFSVMGAKLGKHAGQPVRKGTVDSRTGVASELAKLLRVGVPVASTPLIGLVDTYRKQVSRRSEKAFPEKKTTRRLTAYSARHQLRVDLRASGTSREKTAEMMGHATTKSATYYGIGGRAGSGAVKLAQVSATRPVKQRAAHPGQTKRADATTTGAPTTPRSPKMRR
ncbi:MAG: hypothetical protein KF891_05150 [Rhizobacter sp.]|nr:hypothetical protein [Rhizobacter sp.]